MQEHSAAKASSPRARRRAAERARRREDVLAAAAEVFAERGFHDAQIGEIAARAEVSRATLYELFPGKEAVYTEVILAAAREVRERVRARAEGVPDPADRLLAVVDALFECFEEKHALLRIYARATQGDALRIAPEFGEEAARVFREFSDWVVRLAAEARRGGALPDLDPEAVAAALVGGATVLATRQVECGRGEALGGARAALRRVFEHLLGREPSA